MPQGTVDLDNLRERESLVPPHDLEIIGLDRRTMIL